jgi:hypothetical protein
MQDALIIANFALVLTTLLLAIITGLLVLVTWRYVGHTQKMAEVMVRDYELRVSPMVFENLGETIQTTGRRVKVLTLRNLGTNKAFIKNTSIDCISPNLEFQPISIYRDSDLHEIRAGDSSGFTIDPNDKKRPAGKPSEIVFSYDLAGIDQKFTRKIIKVD